MDLFVVFKYLHVVSMFFAVALAVSTELVVRRVATSHDVGAIRTVVSRAKPLANASTVLFMAGAAFGVVAALTGQINPFASWLLLAYAAFAAAVLTGVFVTDPWVGRLEKAAAESPVEAASAGLRSVVDDPLARYGTWALMALVAILVFIMVVKPLA